MRKRILFAISIPEVSNLPSFIKNDIEILKKDFDVEVVCWRNLRTLFKRAQECDVLFTWFCGVNSAVVTFLARFLGKKAVCVVGGYEAVYMPEINYGLGTQSLFDRYVTTRFRDYTFRKAHRLLAVSKSHFQSAIDMGATAPMELVYNAVDVDKFIPNKKKRKYISTVAEYSGSNIRVKGIPTFLDVVKKDKVHKFVIAGRKGDGNMLSLLEHSKFETGRLDIKVDIPHSRIVDLFQETDIYLQLSAQESFGVSVAEAMASGCIPVVTNRGSLPEIVGDKKLIIGYEDSNAVLEKIHEIDSMSSKEKAELRKVLRERVIKLFSYDVRRNKLKKIIDGLF